MLFKTKRYFAVERGAGRAGIQLNWWKRKAGQSGNPLWLLLYLSAYWGWHRALYLSLPFHLASFHISNRDFETKRQGVFIGLGLLPRIPRREGEPYHRLAFSWERPSLQSLESHA